jgi:hypothetical protein
MKTEQSKNQAILEETKQDDFIKTWMLKQHSFVEKYDSKNSAAWDNILLVKRIYEQASLNIKANPIIL